MIDLLIDLIKARSNDGFCARISRMLIRFLPRKKSDLNLDVGVATLLCHRDVWMFVYCLESFFYFSKMSFPVYIVDDGSLTVEDVALLGDKFTVSVVGGSVRDERILKILKNYPNLQRYRFDASNNVYKKQLDSILASPFKRTIYLDSDVLFFDVPMEIINWLNCRQSKNRYLAYNEQIINNFIIDGNPEFQYRKLVFHSLGFSLVSDVCAGLLLVSLPVKKSILEKMDRISELMYKSGGLPDIYHAVEIVIAPMFKRKNCFSDFFLTITSSLDHFWLWPKQAMVHFAYRSKREFSRSAVKLVFRSFFFN